MGERQTEDLKVACSIHAHRNFNLICITFCYLAVQTGKRAFPLAEMKRFPYFYYSHYANKDAGTSLFAVFPSARVQEFCDVTVQPPWLQHQHSSPASFCIDRRSFTGPFPLSKSTLVSVVNYSPSVSKYKDANCSSQPPLRLQSPSGGEYRSRVSPPDAHLSLN